MNVLFLLALLLLVISYSYSVNEWFETRDEWKRTMKEEMTRGVKEKEEEMITENFQTRFLSTNDISRVVNGIKHSGS